MAQSGLILVPLLLLSIVTIGKTVKDKLSQTSGVALVDSA